MSTQKYISLKEVHLHYSSLAYKDVSLKSYLFKLLGGGKSFAKVESIHALKGVSLEARPGDRIALLGHNGAGKSTLLKSIASLYPISSGKCEIKGKIRGLFELNLGFESEATGRENIMYRGLLLGQSPKQMRLREKDVIEFADIGEFIDYPIKTYSAGMLVRLAFSISTCIPGDLLLLDEVIGAGDALFMNKARTRIMQLIDHAEMLVFATHDLASAQSICNRAIVLEQGNIIFDGEVSAGIHHYKKTIGMEDKDGKDEQ